MLFLTVTLLLHILNSPVVFAVTPNSQPSFEEFASRALAQPACKAVPGNEAWPPDAAWTTLNTAVRGRLLKPAPPAAACFRGQPGYGTAACDKVKDGWKDANWHIDHPTSNMWQNYNNYSCVPNGKACSTSGYPIYVVAAKDSNDVKAAVDFARTLNVRLNIKSTGHDFLGR
jgi:hypothetical protein